MFRTQNRRKEARVKYVAVGSGHIIVAAEALGKNGVLRAVFAAGQGESGQLGLGGTPEFIERFVEVEALRGAKLKGLHAAGWSTWVIVGKGT